MFQHSETLPTVHTIVTNTKERPVFVLQILSIYCAVRFHFLKIFLIWNSHLTHFNFHTLPFLQPTFNRRTNGHILGAFKGSNLFFPSMPLKRTNSGVAWFFERGGGRPCRVNTMIDLTRIMKLLQNHIYCFWPRSQNCRKRLLARFMSVCPSARNKSTHTGRISIKFSIRVLFKNVVIIQVSLKSHRNNGQHFTSRLGYIYDTSLNS